VTERDVSASIFTMSGAAAFLHISTWQLRKRVDDGLIDCVRLSTGERLFERAALEKYRDEAK
jgi:hypothetical protein